MVFFKSASRRDCEQHGARIPSQARLFFYNSVFFQFAVHQRESGSSVPPREPTNQQGNPGHPLKVYLFLKKDIFSTIGVWLCQVLGAQSLQSTELSLQSSKLGLPHSLTRRRVCPLSLWFQWEGSFACWRGGVPITTRGQTLWYSRYMYTVCTVLRDCDS